MRETAEAALREFVSEAQISGWIDLERALRGADDGVWSFRAYREAQGIVRAARLVGPSPWEAVPWPLVRGEVYAALLEVAGFLPPDLPDEKRAAEMDETAAWAWAPYGQRAAVNRRATAEHIRARVVFDPPAGGSGA